MLKVDADIESDWDTHVVDDVSQTVKLWMI